jgi:hypothetical protein
MMSVIMVSVVMLSVVMFSVILLRIIMESRYAECQYIHFICFTGYSYDFFTETDLKMKINTKKTGHPRSCFVKKVENF